MKREGVVGGLIRPRRSSQMESPLNVLFITADQWRGDCLSALGHPMVRTPNLDALAAEGVLFAPHYANTAPCGPEPRLAAHRPLPAEPPLGHQRHAARRAPHQLGAGSGAARLRSGAVRLHRHQPRSARSSRTIRWLRTYEGPLPGIRPVCAIDGAPTPWTDWLTAKGYEYPRTSRSAYGWREPRPRLGGRRGRMPRPLAFPAEVDDAAFLTGQLIDYLKRRERPVRRPPVAAAPASRRSSRPSPTTRSTIPAPCPAFTRARQRRKTRAASIPGSPGSSASAESSRPEQRAAAAAAEGGLLRADEPGGRRDRPADRPS